MQEPKRSVLRNLWKWGKPRFWHIVLFAGFLWWEWQHDKVAFTGFAIYFFLFLIAKWPSPQQNDRPEQDRPTCDFHNGANPKGSRKLSKLVILGVWATGIVLLLLSVVAIFSSSNWEEMKRYVAGVLVLIVLFLPLALLKKKR
jgi:hypothetical protein